MVIQRDDVITTDNVPHMGLALLQNKWNDIPSSKTVHGLKTFTNKKVQYYILTIVGKIRVIFVYMNKTPTFREVYDFGEYLEQEDADFVLGDFNIDRNKEYGQRQINTLERILKMEQVNKESTRHAATLDLIFKKQTLRETDFMPFVYENLYSDHSTVGFRYCRNGVIDESYKEMKIYQQDKEFLRKTTIDGMAEEITDDAKSRIKNKETKKPPTLNDENAREDAIMYKCRVDEVRQSNIRKLLTNEWIDSNLINCYLYLIAAEYSHVLPIDTQFNDQLKTRRFSQINRQFRKENIFGYSVWLLPVNCDNRHWFLLTIDLSCIHEKKIKFNVYDSLGIEESWKRKLEEEKLKMFIRWKYQQENQTRNSLLNFTIEDHFTEIPQQDNGYDCGVFTMLYAKYIASKEQFIFQQEDMPKFRKTISEEIIAGKLVNIAHTATGGVSSKKVITSDSEEIASNAFIRKPKELNLEEPPKFDMEEYKRTRMVGPSSKKERKQDTTKRGRKEESPEIMIIDDEDISTGHNRNSQGVENLKILKFKNSGNRNLCFSNSTVTVLMNIQRIRRILNGEVQLFYENPILQSLKSIYQKLNNTISTTIDLRRVVEDECARNNENRPFNNNQQHDAAEFLQSLLQHLLVDDPLIRTTLFSQTMETMFCCNSNCNMADNHPPSENNIIMLPFKPTLRMSLDSFLAPVDIERNCPHCKICKTASQTTSFTKDPEILIFQIKRFDEHGNKIGGAIDVPTRIDLQSGTMFRMIGTINHYGMTANSGHYTSTLYNRNRQTFYLVNDQLIEEITSLEEIIPGIDPYGNPAPLSTAIYLIIYERE